ncbi:MAG: hypothetical protein R3C05_24640 [Pirellulaceae bacterium]
MTALKIELRRSACIIACIATVLGIAFLTGCRQREEITEYTIPTKVPDILVQQDRMLGAIVPATNKVWFYKLVGAVNDVKPIEDDFKAWVRQLQYEQGEPVLDAPEAWRRIPPGMMQAAKFQIPSGERMLEMSVTELGNSGDWNEQVVANVNRWRGQMGLSPDDGEYAGGEKFEIENPPISDPSIWVALDGRFQSSSPMSGGGPMFGGGPMSPRAPFAGGPSADSGGPSESEPSGAMKQAEAKYEYELPTGWTEGKTSEMRVAAFNVQTKDGPAEVTLIEAGGDMTTNVGIWLGQVKRSGKPEEAQEIVDAGEEITVLGTAGKRFRIIGEESGKAIDVTVVPLRENSSLFIKMSGDTAAVKASEEAFTQFLGTLKSAGKS